MRVEDLMKKEVVTVEPDETIGRAREIMKQQSIRHLVVRWEGELLGVLSDRDVTGVDVPGQSQEARDFLESTPVREVMSESVITIAPGDSVQKAANLMRGNKIGCLVVVEGKKKKLRGIITETDLLEALSRTGGATASNQRRNVRFDRGGRRS